MQNTVASQPGIFYSIDNPAHKFYFGHFLNTARHNVYKIFNHILAKHNQQVAAEEKLADCILLKPSVFAAFTNAADLYEQLKQYLPVLEYLKENNNEAHVFTTLQMLLKDLNSFRNYFTHHYYDKKLAFNNFRETGKFKKSMPYLFGSGVSAARKKTKLPHEVFEEIFKWKADRDNENLLLPVWQQTMLQEDGSPTTFGLVFFTCLFLDAKDSTLLISHIRGLKNTSEDKFKAVRESYTAFAISLPKPPKLESSDIKLDIINELFRVPDVVFKKLTTEQQQHFIIKNEETLQEVKMKRYSNRFDYFALRYFEDNEALPGIKFHLKIGEAFLATYNKTVPGSGITTKRSVTKQLNAFGALQFFHQYKNLTDSGYNIDNLLERQLLNLNGMDVKYMPQYNITDNKIGFKITNENVLIPVVSIRDKKIHDINPFTFTNLTPDAILSTYELPNLYLYNYLFKKGCIPIPADVFLNDIIKNQSPELLLQLKNKNTAVYSNNILFKPNKMPRKLQKHVQDKTDTTNEVKQKLKSFLNETNITITEIQEQGKLEKGKGKKGFTAGSVATWIAKDILFFMKPDAKQQKLSDFEYNTLQGYIAFLGSNQQNIDAFLKAFKITGVNENNRHPFLKPIATLLAEFTAAVKKRQESGRGPKRKFSIAIYSLVRFFIDYLYERRRYIEKLLHNLNEEVINEISYFTKIKPGMAAALDYHEPVMLPRNIFNAAITTGLEKLMQAENKSIVRGDLKKSSPSFFLKQLMPELQSFYSYPRIYKKYKEENGEFEFVEDIVIDAGHDLKKCQIKLKGEGPEYKELQNKIDNIEQDVRLEQYRDRVLFMMLQEYFNNQGIEQIDLTNKSLQNFSKDFKNDTVKTILDIEIDMSLPLHGVNITSKLPVKKYGEFRKVLKDRRMDNLLGYFENEANWQVVQEELEFYNSNREKVLQACIEFEKAVCNKYSVELKPVAKENYISHSAVLKFYHENVFPFPSNYVSENGYIILSGLRNRFLHNQIVEKNLFTHVFPDYVLTDGGITKQIIENVIDFYNQLKLKL